MIPYERQQDGHTCGAACLVMAYRSLGLECTQGLVWSNIAREDAFGRLAARTHLVGQDALRRGFAALVIQAREPWRLLQQAHRHGARALLNQQLYPENPRRHFSVLVDVGEDHVVLHDPYYGPDRRWKRDSFLRLWGPYPETSKVAGYVLVAICPAGQPAASCPVCAAPVPESVRCSGCRHAVPLQPAALLGCADPACEGATWKRVFCPYCDHDMTDLRPGQPPVTAATSTNPKEDNVNLANDIQTLSSKFTDYHAALSEVQAGAPASDARDQLGQLLQQMKETHAQLVTELEKKNQEMEQQMKEAMDKIAAAKAKAAQAKAAQEAIKANAAQVHVPKPVKPVDPALSRKLSEELLRTFGNRPEPAAAPEEQTVWGWTTQPRGR